MTAGRGLEAVIGLEIHVQLRTRRKLFCGDSTRFGDAPNTHVCPVCLGLPGALPTVNREAVDLAVRTAVAFGCTVHERSVFARKNYFYPDLPKGYQITQFERPLATEGRFPVGEGDRVREVRIRRIHMEEDAGKSLHDRFPGVTAVDLNRAGTPLLELVTEPDLRSPARSRVFLQQVKRLLEYLDVSDCNMEEGSLRVDANVSVRPRGEARLGTKTEVKNMNSFSGVEKALTAEIARQGAVLARGGEVEQVTLLWDEVRGEVRPMRWKEESHDYRYFPEPDLPPLQVDPARVEEIRAGLPETPWDREARFREGYGLPPYDAGVLTASRELADYFEAVARRLGEDPKRASNWVMGPVLAAMKRREGGIGELPLDAGALAELIELERDGTVSGTVAREVLGTMLETGRRARPIVEEQGLTQVRDRDRLEAWVEAVLEAHPGEVARYRDGETRLHGFFMGRVMKRSGGRADPGEAARLLSRKLEG